MNNDPTCHYCKATAVALCDFIVGIPTTKCTGNVVQILGLEQRCEESKTCDRAICDEHRVRVGHFCNRSRPSLSNTIDHCLDHAT